MKEIDPGDTSRGSKDAAVIVIRHYPLHGDRGLRGRQAWAGHGAREGVADDRQPSVGL
jgi:hypothetical protein